MQERVTTTGWASAGREASEELNAIDELERERPITAASIRQVQAFGDVNGLQAWLVAGKLQRVLQVPQGGSPGLPIAA